MTPNDWKRLLGRNAMAGALAFVASFLLLPRALDAQTALTGGVNGRVVDATGAALPGAAVTIASSSLGVTRDTTTGDDGSFAIAGLTPSTDYRIHVRLAQFREWSRDLAVTSSASAAIEARLDVMPLTEATTVTAETSRASVASPVLAEVVGAATMSSVPTFGRQTNRVALLDPHVRNTQGFGGDSFIATRLSINGASFRDTHYRLDGDVNNDAFTNNAPMQPVSLGAVQEFKILTNQYSAEFGGTSAGLLVLTTKSGSDAFRGDIFVQGRPETFSADPPLAAMRVPNTLWQSGASIGGPIVRGRTFFFGSVEMTRQNRGSVITSPAPSTFVGELREYVGLGRIDHQIGTSNTLGVRVNGHRTSNNNPNDRVGGLVQPSAGQRSRISSFGTQVSDRAVAGERFGGLFNELRLNYVESHPSDTTPLTPAVGVVRPGYSSEGFSGTSTLRLRLYQASDQVSLQRGRHAVRAGGEVVHQRYADFQASQFGDYRFAPGPPVAGERPEQYTQRFGVADLRYRDTRAALFVQDDWRVRSSLTLNLGLRYEYQESVGDTNNIAPRVGVVFDPSGTGRTVLRGGVGVFYDQAFQHGLRQRFLLDGPQSPTQTITLTPGDPGFPTFPASLTEIPGGLMPARRSVYVRGDDMVNPASYQVSFGVQHRLTTEWTGTIDVVHSRTYDQFLARNLNAPAPFPRTVPGLTRSAAAADATRPLAAFEDVPVRNVLASGNGGRAYYDSIAFGLSRQFSRGFEISAKYLYARVEDSITDDHHGANPNEWSDIVDAERGPSEFAQPHRFVAYGRASLPGAIDVSGVVTLASGVPVNPLTGIDNNGDTTNTDRPAGFGRNSFRGPRHTRVDLAAARRFAVGGIQIEGRAEIFNLFGAENYFRFNNIYGNGADPLATFLQPVGGVGNVDPGRQFLLGARLRF